MLHLFSVGSLHASRLLNPSANSVRFPSSTVEVVQVTGLSLSDLFLLAWLRLSAEALLVDCGYSLDVFAAALANYRPNEIQI